MPTAAPLNLHLLDGRVLTVLPISHQPDWMQILGPRGGELGRYTISPLRELLTGARDSVSGNGSGDLTMIARRSSSDRFAPVSLEFVRPFSRTGRNFQASADELERVAGLLPVPDRNVTVGLQVPGNFTEAQIAELVRTLAAAAPHVKLVRASLDNRHADILAG